MGVWVISIASVSVKTLTVTLGWDLRGRTEIAGPVSLQNIPPLSVPLTEWTKLWSTAPAKTPGDYCHWKGFIFCSKSEFWFLTFLKSLLGSFRFLGQRDIIPPGVKSFSILYIKTNTPAVCDDLIFKVALLQTHH